MQYASKDEPRANVFDFSNGSTIRGFGALRANSYATRGSRGADMAKLPDGITREHLIAAIHDFDRGVEHDFHDSTKYDVVHDGCRYPPKVIVGLAAGHLLGKPLGPVDFKGGLGTKCFRILEAANFAITIKLEPGAFPDDLGADPHFEGAHVTVLVNRFERDVEARRNCIEYHGARCQVCGLDFADEYGTIGKGFIHVHHIVPLSEVRARYVVDPVKDLWPVCPNCHAMLHRRRPPLTIEQLKRLRTAAGRGNLAA